MSRAVRVPGRGTGLRALWGRILSSAAPSAPITFHVPAWAAHLP